MTKKYKPLGEEQVQLIARALGDPRRYEILKLLGEKADEVSCESMRGCVDISPATLSHHMKELELAGLVQVDRRGKFAYYLLQRQVLEGFFERVRRDLV